MAKINCPKCNKEYEIDSKLEWKKVKCSECWNIFVLDFSKNDDIEIEEKDEIKNEEKIEVQEGKEIIESKSEEIKDDKVIKEENKSIEKEDDIVIKPNKKSYILLGSPILLFSIITIIAFFMNMWIWLLLLWFTAAIYYWFNIKFKKEEYILSDRKIIYNYWNLFSDNSIEVQLDKITEVRSILWFIQYKIFWTWNLRIKTAWSDNSAIYLRNIDSTMDIYDNVQVRMRKNGFHLLKDKLVQTAKPHWLWIVWEIFWKIIANFFIVFVLFWNLITELSNWSITSGWILIILPTILFIIVMVLIIIVSYLDLKRRQYDVYTDSIFYTEWFLTKHYAFLPMESVADTENTQSFFSKIFWLHDVVVSSEWSNNKVSFKNMLDWEQMMKNIKYLKDNIIMWEKDVLKWEEKSINSLIWFKDKIEKPLDYDKSFKWEYKMSMLKSLILTLPSIVFPPAFVAVIIIQIIRVKFTTFLVEESSIEKKFEFLSKKHNSFSVEKITWVIIKESLLDKLLWTCSISFWSIGSSSNITFSNIKKSEDLEKNILAKVWVKLEEDKKSLPINFSFINYIKSNIWATLFFILLFFVLILVSIFINEINLVFVLLGLIPFFVIFILIFIYKIFYYKSSRFIQHISNDYIESISGIFFVSKYYIMFRNIKWMKSMKYPLTNTWTLIFNVSWEQSVETKWKKWFSIISNSVKIPFVSNVFDTHSYFDNILNESKIDTNLLTKSKQDVWNSIFLISILAIIIWAVSLWIDLIVWIALSIFFLIIIWLVIWIIKVKYYNFEKDRVLFWSWIIYKRRQSILYSKFNFIEKNQGFINKIFKNGIVKIYTLWSWRVEMLLKDIDNFKDIYELLKKD